MEPALFVDLSDKNRLIREEAGANAIRSAAILSQHRHRDRYHLPNRWLYQIGKYLLKELPSLRRDFWNSPASRPDELPTCRPLSVHDRRLHLRSGHVRQQLSLRVVRGLWHVEGQVEIDRRIAGATNWRLTVHFQEQLHFCIRRSCRLKADCWRDWGVWYLAQRLAGDWQLAGG
jgi:hypothetical protein